MDKKCQVHIINMTPVPLTINAGVTIVPYEYPDLPIREFDLPIPSPVCSATVVTSSPGNPSPKHILQNLFKEFPNVMPTEERPIGKTTLLQHSITLEPDAKPLYIPSYRIPHLKRQALEKEVKAMLEMNLIWPSNSPWASPLLVPKKDNTLGPVVDYRKLNKVTVLEPFPISNLRLLLQDIGSNNSLFNNRPCQGIPAGPYGI